MKEILPKIYKLETMKERADFFDARFVTKEFKQFIESGHPVIKNIRDSYIMYPRYFYNMQDKDLERAAFTSWYNVLSLKTYENQYIQDLYYFHELTHIATMSYEPELDFTSWCLKMRNNEVLASMNSEVFIYFYIPEYRQYTFKEEIWADRFLSRDHYTNMAKNNIAQLSIELTAKRTEAYDNPKDKVEQVLKDFRQFSFLYYNVWKDHYKELETVLKDFYKGNEAGYEEWLKANQSDKGILFEERVKLHQENYNSRNKNRPHY